MICWAVPPSLGPRDLGSVWADPVENVWDEGASEPVVGSDRGMISMASAQRQGEESYAKYQKDWNKEGNNLEKGQQSLPGYAN